MKKIWFMVLAMGMLVSCSEESGTTSSGSGTVTPPVANPSVSPLETETVTVEVEEKKEFSLGSGYLCNFSGVAVQLGEEFAPILEELGEPMEYFEAPSCAFEGLDKIYYYSGFEVRTCPEGEDDFVSAILLKDDMVMTPEGVYIGMDFQEALGLSGEEYSVEGSHYSYVDGDGIFTLVESEGAVIGIIYVLNGTQEN